MSGQSDPYVRVYYRIVNDERFADVYHDARPLGTWLQLLLLADAMFPADAPLPAHVTRPALKVLVDAGLVELALHGHYRMHGLASERHKCTESARIASAVRWHTERNAEGMPSRAEPSRAETSRAEPTETDASAGPLALYFELSGGRVPSQGGVKWMNDLEAEHGADLVEWAMQCEATDKGVGRNFLSGVRNRLVLAHDSRERADRERKKAEEVQAAKDREQRRQNGRRDPESTSAVLTALPPWSAVVGEKAEA